MHWTVLEPFGKTIPKTILTSQMFQQDFQISWHIEGPETMTLTIHSHAEDHYSGWPMTSTWSRAQWCMITWKSARFSTTEPPKFYYVNHHCLTTTESRPTTIYHITVMPTFMLLSTPTGVSEAQCSTSGQWACWVAPNISMLEPDMEGWSFMVMTIGMVSISGKKMLAQGKRIWRYDGGRMTFELLNWLYLMYFPIPITRKDPTKRYKKNRKTFSFFSFMFQ